jgi:5-methylcytosine-specific restriction protein B
LTKTLAEDLQDIWQMEIEPYLEEYFFDNQEKMDEFLWDKIKEKLSN